MGNTRKLKSKTEEKEEPLELKRKSFEQITERERSFLWEVKMENGGGEGEKVNRKMQMTFPTLLVQDLDIKVICTFALKINI